jgi:hypothetical protein
MPTTRSRRSPEPTVQASIEPRAVHLACLLGGALGGRGDLGVPVVGLRPELEQRRRVGVADADHADLHAEEPDVLAAELIEVVEGLAVLLTKSRRQPDHRPGVGTSRVGEQLAEVAMVGIRELVLNDQDAVVGHVAAHQVQGEPAHRVLGGGQLKVDAERLGERVGVRKQPRGEVVSLMRPDASRVEGLEPT